MESFDIGFDNLEPIKLNFNETPQSSSSNFGPGVELLMNNTRKSENNNVKFDLNELDTLEKELNDLSNSNKNSDSNTKTFSGLGGFSDFTSNLFGFDNKQDKSNSKVEDTSDSNLGQATKDTFGNNKTWDGFTKFNDIPSDNTGGSYSSSSNLNSVEKRRKKRMMIKKLEEWYEKGFVKNISHYNIDSPYEEIEDEYESALDDKRLKDGIKLQGWWFMTFVNSIEYANASFNPFDINLDGWGEQVSEDIDSYEELFSELHDKYKGSKLSPELSLLLRLGFSAAIVNFTNKALSTATPGFNDVIKQSPELMKMFTNATVSSMSQQSPGFAFASSLVNSPDKINTSFGPPPPAMETKNQPTQVRPSMQFTQAPGNRQDINAARGSMFREQGLDVNNNYGDAQMQQNTQKSMGSFYTQQAQPMQQAQQAQQAQQSQQSQHGTYKSMGSFYTQQSQQQPSQQRHEMRGPQNTEIDNILSGLKTINITDRTPEPSYKNQDITVESIYPEDESIISISSLKDLHSQNITKRTKRSRNKSDKNTISLDI